MKITEARIRMADGTEAVFVGDTAELTTLPPSPYVAIPVADAEAAIAAVDTLERSRARKRASEKDEPETSKPGPGPLPPKCIAPDCLNEATIGSPGGGEPRDLCHAHALAPDSTVNEWRQKVTPKPEAKRRARGIREGVEGEPGKVA